MVYLPNDWLFRVLKLLLWITQVFINWSTYNQNVAYTINPMKYYSAIKRNEVLTYVTTRMVPEDIILSGTSQTWKRKYQMIPHIWAS